MTKKFSWLQTGWRSFLRCQTEFEWSPLILINGLLLGTFLALRQVGLLQLLELAVYDQMLRWRSPQPPDTRILVVEITQQDLERFPDSIINDAEFAQILSTLQRHKPAVIGVDVLLEPSFPPGTAELHTQLRQPKVISVTSLGNNALERTPPPPYLPSRQIAFIDIPVDPDGVTRRSTLIPFDPQFTYPAFSRKLVETYLAANCPGYTPKIAGLVCQDIRLQVSPQGEYTLGKIRLPKLKKNSGAYQNLDDRGYQLLINYRAAQAPTLQVTLGQLQQGEVNPDWIHNKIVLIGFSAPLMKDVFDTPFTAAAMDYQQMPGVVVHAQMVSQLLSVGLDGQPLFRFWPEGAELVWIILWAIAGSYLTWVLHRPKQVIFGGVALLGLLGSSSFLLFLNYIWIPIVAPALASILAGVATIIYKQYLAQQQRQMVMHLLGQQTSSEIAQTLWQQRQHLLTAGRLPCQKVTATILFSDLKNFSTISEQQPPEVIMGWLNQYLADMTEEIHAHHGIINKFMGDGIMAVFGVPIARTSTEAIAADAQAAVHCAIAMRQRLTELNQTPQPQDIGTLQMRIGIFTGPVIVGSLGNKTHLEYAVIGDGVNTASRLESCEKDRQIDDCRILIAQSTLDYLQDIFTVEAWGTLTLKGKQQSVSVYRVIAAKSI